MPFMSLKAIPFDPFLVFPDGDVQEVTEEILRMGTPQSLRGHDWLKIQLEQALDRVERVPAGMALRIRSRDGMVSLSFSSGLLGSGQIVGGIDALTHRAVYQVRGSSLAAPVASALLGAVRPITLELEKPLRVLARPKGPAVFDPAMYRPNRLMVFRPRGRGRTEVTRHRVVDAYTCWVDSASALLNALVTGVEIAREAVERSLPSTAVHAFVDDSVPWRP